MGYVYSLNDNMLDEVACIELSEIADTYFEQVSDEEMLDRIPEPQVYTACVNNMRGVRIGSRKRFRGLMLAAGFSRYQTDAVIRAMPQHRGQSYQILWYKLVSTALLKRLTLNLKNTFTVTMHVDKDDPMLKALESLKEGLPK